MHATPCLVSAHRTPGAWQRHGRYVALLVSLWVASGCQSQAAPGVAGPPSADMPTEKVLIDRIHTEIGQASCDTDTQCRTLAVGEKSCGGPQAWFPLSTRDSDEAALRQLAAQLAALQRERYARSGEMSNCLYQPDPGAICVTQRCVLRAPNTAN